MDNTKIKIDVELNTIKDLQQALKQVKNEMVGLEEGSDAFKEAAAKAGELKHQIDAINESVRGASADFGDMVGNVTKVGAGLTGAFQAAQGAMTLFGSESENVTKAIQKMQAVMALTQGLSTIDQGVKSFAKLKTVIGINTKAMGGFKKALIGTGIGAAVVAVGELVAHWDELKDMLGLSEKQLRQFGKAWDTIVGAIVESAKKAGRIIKDAFTFNFSGLWNELTTGINLQEQNVEKSAKRIKKHTDGIKDHYDKLYERRLRDAALEDDEEERLKKIIYAEKERNKNLRVNSKEWKEWIVKLKDLEEQLYDVQTKRANDALNIQLEKNKRLFESDKERIDQEIQIETQRLNLLDKETLAYEQQKNKIEGLKKQKDQLVSKEQNEAIDVEIKQFQKLAKTDSERIQVQIEGETKRLSLLKEGSKEYAEQQEVIKKLEEDRTAAIKSEANEQIDIQLEQNKRIQQSESERLEFEIQLETQRLGLLEEGSLAYEKQITNIENLKSALKIAKEDEEGPSVLSQLEEMSLYLRDISTLFDKISDGWGAGFDALAQTMAVAQKAMEEFGKSSQKAGDKAALGLKVAAVAAQGVGSILNSVAAEQNANTKEGFEKQKKLQIGAAVMNMLGGITAAIASCWSPQNAWQTSPVQAAMAAINAATVATMGGIQIAQIQRQTFDGGASGAATANVAAPALPALSSPVQYTQDIQGPSLEGAIADTRVYVTETDITSAQKKVDVTETESKF